MPPIPPRSNSRATYHHGPSTPNSAERPSSTLTFTYATKEPKGTFHVIQSTAPKSSTGRRAPRQKIAAHRQRRRASSQAVGTSTSGPFASRRQTPSAPSRPEQRTAPSARVLDEESARAKSTSDD